MTDIQLEISRLTNKKTLKNLTKGIEKRMLELIAMEYAQGKIYMIVHKETKVLAYIGSTIHELITRFYGHKSFLKANPNSKYARYIDNAGGIDAFEIILIENYPCQNRTELMSKEMHHIIDKHPPCNSFISKAEEAELGNLSENHDILEKEAICYKCGFIAGSKSKLEAHLNRKNPCDVGKYHCDNCHFRSNNRTSIYGHRKTCKGFQISKTALLKELEQYKNNAQQNAS